MNAEEMKDFEVLVNKLKYKAGELLTLEIQNKQNDLFEPVS